MTSPMFRRGVLAAALLACTATVANPAFAQSRTPGGEKERSARKEAPAAEAAAERYPQATRAPEKPRASAKGAKLLQQMLDLHEKGQAAQARAAADAIVANDNLSAYDRAFAAQFAGQLAFQANDAGAAMDYLNRALQLDGLDNDSHYNSMFMLSQLQVQGGDYAGSLSTLDRFFAETRSTAPEHLVMRGNALYRLKRYPEAITVLRQAIDSAPDARADWQQLLMAAYADSGQTAEAKRLAEAVAAKTPGDKRSQMNLVVTYLQSNENEKAVEILERLRAAGDLTDESDYRQLYVAYLNMDGREKDAIRVIEDGLQQGILKPEFNTHLALAQAYYFTDQLDKAVENYRKAAPMGPDGETYLNLARVLWTSNRVAEAKEAARQAKAKGVKNTADVEKILALPAK